MSNLIDFGHYLLVSSLTLAGLYTLMHLMIHYYYTDHDSVLHEPLDKTKTPIAPATLQTNRDKLNRILLSGYILPFSDEQEKSLKPSTFAIYRGDGDTAYLSSDNLVSIDGVFVYWIFEVTVDECKPSVSEFFAVENEWRTYRTEHLSYVGEVKTPEAFLKWLSNEPVQPHEIFLAKTA